MQAQLENANPTTPQHNAACTIMLVPVCVQTFQAYGWPHDEKVKPAVVQRAVETLSKPAWGFRSLLAAVPACILVALMALNTIAAWFYSIGYFIFLAVIFGVITIFLFYTLFHYVMVTRIIEGTRQQNNLQFQLASLAG